MRFRRDSNRLHPWALTRGRAERAGATRGGDPRLGDGRKRAQGNKLSCDYTGDSSDMDFICECWP